MRATHTPGKWARDHTLTHINFPIAPRSDLHAATIPRGDPLKLLRHTVRRIVVRASALGPFVAIESPSAPTVAQTIRPGTQPLSVTSDKYLSRFAWKENDKTVRNPVQRWSLRLWPGSVLISPLSSGLRLS